MVPHDDGLIGRDDFPQYMPDLTAPPKKKPSWAEEVPDALNREQYLAIGRPLLIAAGLLTVEGTEANDKPPLPPMPNSKLRKPRKPKIILPQPTPPPAAPEPPKPGGNSCPF